MIVNTLVFVLLLSPLSTVIGCKRNSQLDTRQGAVDSFDFPTDEEFDTEIDPNIGFRIGDDDEYNPFDFKKIETNSKNDKNLAKYKYEIESEKVVQTTVKPIQENCIGAHKKYTTCGPCFTSDCKKPDLGLSCNIYNSTCKAQCLCECGYFRAPNGKCVPKEECPCFNNFEYLEYCALSFSLKVFQNVYKNKKDSTKTPIQVTVSTGQSNAVVSTKYSLTTVSEDNKSPTTEKNKPVTATESAVATKATTELNTSSDSTTLPTETRTESTVPVVIKTSTKPTHTSPSDPGPHSTDFPLSSKAPVTMTFSSKPQTISTIPEVTESKPTTHPPASVTFSTKLQTSSQPPVIKTFSTRPQTSSKLPVIKTSSTKSQIFSTAESNTSTEAPATTSSSTKPQSSPQPTVIKTFPTRSQTSSNLPVIKTSSMKPQTASTEALATATFSTKLQTSPQPPVIKTFPTRPQTTSTITTTKAKDSKISTEAPATTTSSTKPQTASTEALATATFSTKLQTSPQPSVIKTFPTRPQTTSTITTTKAKDSKTSTEAPAATTFSTKPQSSPQPPVIKTFPTRPPTDSTTTATKAKDSTEAPATTTSSMKPQTASTEAPATATFSTKLQTSPQPPVIKTFPTRPQTTSTITTTQTIDSKTSTETPATTTSSTKPQTSSTLTATKTTESMSSTEAPATATFSTKPTSSQPPVIKTFPTRPQTSLKPPVIKTFPTTPRIVPATSTSSTIIKTPNYSKVTNLPLPVFVVPPAISKPSAVFPNPRDHVVEFLKPTFPRIPKPERSSTKPPLATTSSPFSLDPNKVSSGGIFLTGKSDTQYRIPLENIEQLKKFFLKNKHRLQIVPKLQCEQTTSTEAITTLSTTTTTTKPKTTTTTIKKTSSFASTIKSPYPTLKKNANGSESSKNNKDSELEDFNVLESPMDSLEDSVALESRTNFVVAPNLENCQYSCGGDNEEFSFCASNYGDSCMVALYQPSHCRSRCRPACACRKNYARHPVSRRCIPVSDCPKLFKNNKC